MCDETRNVLAAQTEIGVRLRDGSHPSIKVLASRAGWHQNRFAGYFPADPSVKPTQLSLGALHVLIRKQVLPVELLDMLAPDGSQIVQTPEEIDPYVLAELAREFLALKAAAHHPDSEAGEAIGPVEKDELIKSAAKLKAVA